MVKRVTQIRGIVDTDTGLVTDLLPDVLGGGGKPTLVSMGSIDRSIAAALIAGFSAQAVDDAVNGPAILARASLPVAADVPVITGISGAPSADTDAAAQILYTHGVQTDNLVPIPPATLKKAVTRGYSQGSRQVGLGGRVCRYSEALNLLGQNAEQDLDPVTGYGLTEAGCVMTDVILEGDVLFFPDYDSGGGAHEIYINGSLLTTAAGTNITRGANNRSYSLTTSSGAQNFKLKWGTVARRRVTIISVKFFAPGRLHTRQVSTIFPAVSKPIRWGHLGGSFSRYTITSAPTLGVTHWMHRAFGLQIDFTDAAQGSTGFSASTNRNLPGVTPVAGKAPSTRLQYELNLRQCDLDILSLLIGINDAPYDQAEAVSEFRKFLIQVLADKPRTKIFVFSSESSPASNSTGDTAAMEAKFAAVAADYPAVTFFPLLTGPYGAYHRGTGREGATNGSGNSDLITGTDALHPNDFGAKVLGQLMSRLINDWLVSAKA